MKTRGLKWAVLATWLVLIAAGSGFAGKIWSITEDNATSFLPRSAESTEVAKLQERFGSGDQPPAIVVFHRAAGLTDTDREHAATGIAALTARYGLVASSPDEARDGNTLIYAVRGTEYDIPGIRQTVGQGGPGLDVKVTGAAAFQYDLDQTYQGIDGTLLLVTIAIVSVLLLLTYRSIVLWIVPLFVVALANQLADAVMYLIAKATGQQINSAAIFVITVLVYGVGTDYALLIITRYREELRRHADRHEAMRVALKGAFPAILASSATVALGLICMMAADLNSTRGLGPAGAVGVVCAFAAMVTLLPALLVILGRWVFWPLVPRHGEPPRRARSVWTWLGDILARRPRLMWTAAVVLLGVLALGLVGTSVGVPQEKAFRGSPDSVAGQQLLSASFSAGTGQPVTVIVGSSDANAVTEAASATPGVTDVRRDGTAGELSRIQVTVDAAPGSPGERQLIERLRDSVHQASNGQAKVGGAGAQALDTADTARRDELIVIPLILAVVLAVLILLLRSIVGPVLLVASVVVSFAAAMGITGWLSTHVFGFGGIDPTLTLSAFAFLVAVGVDYNIFLVSRIRQETMLSDTSAGTRVGLVTTGGVITSAGLVLAGTFAALTVLPVTATVQLGVAVAIGVLLDTLLVRSVLVPALIFDLRHRFWWPSQLGRPSAAPASPRPRAGEPEAEVTVPDRV